MKLRLVNVASGAEFELRQQLVAGRLAECDIQLSLGLPSRRHAQITRVDDVAWVEDLGSANGTYVNGERIQARTRLNPGDIMRFDVEEFRLVGEPEAQEVDAATQFRPSGAATGEQAKLEASGVFKRPGAWVDPDSAAGGQKTKFMDPAMLRSMIDSRNGHGGAPGGSADGPSLLLLSGARKGALIRLQPQPGQIAEWSIGSGEECGIRLEEEGVSALHARLSNDGQRWKIVDQMSANGIYVNGKRATMAYLGGNDRIGVGPVECELVLPMQPRAVVGAQRPPAVAHQPRGRWIIALVVLLLALAALAAWWWM